MHAAGSVPVSSRRAGFTILELMVAMVITAVLGMALVRTMVSSNQFIDRIESGREARGAARAGLNLTTSELRMVSAGTGVEAATATSVTVRVPFRFGVSCASSVGAPGLVVAMMMPADTTIASTSLGYNGFATLGSGGEYTYVNTLVIPTVGVTATCTGTPANLSLVISATVASLTGIVPALIAPATPIMLWRRVRYEFGASAATPGRLALWRRQLNNAGTITQSDEIASPLDTASRFGFYINNSRVASDTVPTALGNLRGIELRLTGASARTARGTTRPEQSRVLSSVFFLNRPD